MSLSVPPVDASRSTVISTGTILGSRIRGFSAAVTPASTAWPANNQAYLIPFQVSSPITLVEMFFISGTGPGTANFDLGIYNDTFSLLGSIGATAATNTTDVTQPAGGKALAPVVTLVRGRYFLAMSAAATSITVRSAVNANQIARALGMYTMATAHPLPTTFVPATMSTTAFIPTIGATTITNIL